jgi:hypothetical protein
MTVKQTQLRRGVVLRQLKDEGMIASTGKGRVAKWKKQAVDCWRDGDFLSRFFAVAVGCSRFRRIDECAPKQGFSSLMLG